MDIDSVDTLDSNVPTNLEVPHQTNDSNDDWSVPPPADDNYQRHFSSSHSVTSTRSEARAYAQPRVPLSAAARVNHHTPPRGNNNNNNNNKAAANDFSVGLYCLAVMRNPEDDDVTSYKGSCQCQSVKFEILAPQEDLIIQRSKDEDAANDKIYYRYTKIKTSHFEISEGQDSLTTYYVEMAPKTRYYIRKTQGARAFCNRCGVHILYAPSKNSPFMHINANCVPGLSPISPSTPSPTKADETTNDGTYRFVYNILKAGQSTTTEMTSVLLQATSQVKDRIEVLFLASLKTWKTIKGQ